MKSLPGVPVFAGLALVLLSFAAMESALDAQVEVLTANARQWERRAGGYENLFTLAERLRAATELPDAMSAERASHSLAIAGTSARHELAATVMAAEGEALDAATREVIVEGRIVSALQASGSGATLQHSARLATAVHALRATVVRARVTAWRSAAGPLTEIERVRGHQKTARAAFIAIAMLFAVAMHSQSGSRAAVQAGGKRGGIEATSRFVATPFART